MIQFWKASFLSTRAKTKAPNRVLFSFWRQHSRFGAGFRARSARKPVRICRAERVRLACKCQACKSSHPARNSGGCQTHLGKKMPIAIFRQGSEVSLYLAYLGETFVIFISNIFPFFMLSSNKIHKHIACGQRHMSRYAVGEKFVCFEKNFENSKTFS